jgi:hypothetical protein
VIVKITSSVCLKLLIKVLGRTQIRMFENRVVRIIFEPKREEVIGNWRKSRNEEFIIYFLPSILLE